MPWNVNYVLQDGNGQQTKVGFSLGQFGYVENDPFEYNLVWSAVAQIEAEFADVTQANIIRRTISYVRDLGGGNGAGDVADEAFLSVRLDTASPAYASIRIPAPVAAIITPDGKDVVEANADLVAFLEQLEQHARFGVTETAEIQSPVEIYNAYIRSVKRKRK